MPAEQNDHQVLRICSYDHGGYTAWGWWKSWDGPGGLKEYIRRSIDRLDQFPKLKWGFHIDGATWDWVLANDPAFVAKFKDWVDHSYAGRISLSSGGYGQPLSCTIGAEANIRHLTYDREVYDRLGYRIHIYMQNEHGFFPQMPQLLKGVGIDKAILRTVWGMYGICPEINASKIRWRSPEGSWVEAIPTYKGENRGLGKNTWDTRIIIGLEGQIDFEPFRRHYLDEGIRFPVAVRIDDFPLPYDHDGSGGFKRLCSYSDKPGYRWVTGEEAFAEIPLEDVTLDSSIDDYPIQMPWGYCGNIFWNLSRQAESTVLTAERLAAINTLYQGANWEEVLNRAWKQLLTAQHHDINICGVSSGGEFGEFMVDVAKRFYGEAIELAQTVMKANLKAMLMRMNSARSDRSIIAFNPLNWARQTVVFARVKSEKNRLPKGFRVTYAGQPLDYQVVREEIIPGGYLSYTTLAIRLSLPPLSLALVNVDLLCETPEPARIMDIGETDQAITVAAHWGRLRIDREMGECLVYNSRNQPLLVPDGHNGVLTAVIDNQPYISKPQQITVAQNGPLFAVIRTSGKIGPLPYTTEVTVYRDELRLDFKTIIEVHGQSIGETNTPSEWDGKDEPVVQDKKLLVHFTPALTGPVTVRQDFPFSMAETRHQQINAGYWADVSDEKRGLTFKNRGTMGYLWDGATLSNILLYSGKYSWGEAQAFLDGTYELEYSLSFHEDPDQPVQAHRAGLEYNFPVITHSGTSRDGVIPDSDCRLTVYDPNTGEPCDNIIVSALYTRQSRLYLRAYDFTGRKAVLGVKWGEQTMKLVPVDLLHEPTGGVADFAEIPPFGIRTFQLQNNLLESF